MDKALEQVPHGHYSCCCEGVSVAPRKDEDKQGRDGRCGRLLKEAKGPELFSDS